MSADVTPSPAELAATARRFLPNGWDRPTVKATDSPAAITAAHERAVDAVVKAWGLAEHYLRSQAEQAARNAERAAQKAARDWRAGGSWT